jgi:hypothetical protein
MMTTKELFEAAQLDALGLLEEAEREAFEEALATVPAALRLQIRAEQTRLADYDPFVRNDVPSDLAPPPGLKDSVLAAWRGALGRETARRVVHADAQDRPSSVRLRAARRVSPLWRAVAIGFMATAVVSGVVSLQVLNRYQELRATADSNEVIDWINSNRSAARQLSEALTGDPLMQTVRFEAQTGGALFKGKAAVFFNPDKNGKALLCCQNLPSSNGQTYKIVRRNSDGTTETLSEIPRSDGFAIREFDITKAASDLASLAIVMIARDGTETTVLTAHA